MFIFKLSFYCTRLLQFIFVMSFVLMLNYSHAADTIKPAKKTEQFLNSRLPVGFYIYLYNFQAWNDPDARDVDQAIEKMAAMGFNYLYVGGVSDTPLWGRILTLCEKLHIAVVPQLDFAYLGFVDPKTIKVEDLVFRAVPFIKKYKDSPALMAFSVCEEPTVQIMPVLRKYYEGIMQEVPDAPLMLIVNHFPQLAGMEPPYPGIIGADRYSFWWEMSGHRATPWYALKWYHTQLDSYYQLATERGADFQAIFTASTLETFTTHDVLKTWLYPNTMELSQEAHKKFFIDPAGALSAEDRNLLYKTILEFAVNKNQGWENAQDKLRFWKYYRPPVNCVRAMSWLGIMEGARSVAVWAWQPPYKNMIDLSYRTNGKENQEYINSITGWDGKGTVQLDEYSEFAGQIQRYAKLVRVMTKVCNSLDKKNLPLGHELCANTEGAKNLLDVKGEDVTWQAFNIPGYSGKVIVLVNTRVGSWCDGRAPHYLTPKDVFRIDDLGNAIDYVPFTESRELKFSVIPPGMECVDLKTGDILATEDDHLLSLSIVPGGGRFLFISHKGSLEWERLKQQFSL